jgi:MFS family permease
LSTPASAATPGPFDRAFFRLTIGLIAAITLVSFEALGVAAAMPAAAKDLHGEQWYGATFALLLLGQLVGTAALGNSIDVRGPRLGFVCGLGMLILGLIIGGSAERIAALLVSRLFVGVGSGAIFTIGYATVGLCYPDEVRPRVNAAVSSAWVLPGLLGPGFAGWLTDQHSWRWAFYAVIPIAIAAAVIVLPVLPKTGHVQRTVGVDLHIADRFWTMTSQRRTALGVFVAFGAGMFLSGLADIRLWPLIPVGLVVLFGALRGGLLPRAVFRAQAGLGATVAAVGLLVAGYSCAEAFVPLTLQRLRQFSSTEAGLALTLASVLWTVGSWLHGRRPALLRSGRNAQYSVLLTGIGVACMAGLAWRPFPVAFALIGWTCGALGMGLTYNLLSERPFQLVDTSQVGAISSAIQIANALGGAVASGVGGALVARFAAASQNGEPVATPTGLALALGCSLVCLCVSALIIRRSLLSDATGFTP